VPFVDEHEVVALKSLDGHCPVAHLIAQLVDVDDLDGRASEERLGVLAEYVRLNAGRLEFGEVL
jgi:hypothetical protein